MNTEATPEVYASSDLGTPSLTRVRTSKAAKTGEAWEKIPRRAAGLLHELSSGAAKLWMAYRLHQFGPDNSTYVKTETLSRETGLSLDAIGRCRKELFAKGWLFFVRFHRSSDGTLFGRTFECRAVVPEIAADGTRKVKEPPKRRQRPDRRGMRRGNNGRFVPRTADTDNDCTPSSANNGESPSSEDSPTTVFSPLTNNGFSAVTDNGVTPLQTRPSGKDIFCKTGVKGEVATYGCSSSSSCTPDDDDNQQAVVGVSVSFKKASPAIDEEPPSERASIASLNGQLHSPSGRTGTKATKPGKKRQVNEDEVVNDLDQWFHSMTRTGSRGKKPEGFPFWTDAKQYHRDFYVSKVRYKGLQRVHDVVARFAMDDHKFDEMCPAAVLMSRWPEYEEKAIEEESQNQDPNRWSDAVDLMENFGETSMSPSQKDRVRELAARYGTGHIEDAYCEYSSSGASGLDAFLADPAPYLEAAA
jgi:hypothetical protein